ncbi:pentapeptide repeat-containing protein [Reyranella sp.]|uniref:pentapeptide repeat-containing protein n=1 Tax=Reyranella sp. TaxID=1929291 RepID=UPI0025D5A943|nr:pentapeptide repeat-containing protein [Reyranella sp.]
MSLAGIDLSSMNLAGIDLSGANLAGADLGNADLRSSILRGATLRGAYMGGMILRGANLQGALMSGAILQGANLQGALLFGADMSGCYFGGADLSFADLKQAILKGTVLRDVPLIGANLAGANLEGADVDGVRLCDAVAFPEATIPLAVPEVGSYIGWKKCKNEVIVKLLIPAEARRSSAATRRARAEFAQVLKVYGAEVGVAMHDGTTEYRAGNIVRSDKWGTNRWDEFSGGIYHFITRAEAEAYARRTNRWVEPQE